MNSAAVNGSPFAGCESLRILVGAEVSQAVRNLSGIARCLGVSVAVIQLGDVELPREKLMSQLAAPSCAVVIDVGSVSVLVSGTELAAFASAISGLSPKILLLVTSADVAASEWVSAFTRGRVSAVRDAGIPECISFPAASRAFAAELAGHSFQRSTRKAIGMESPGNGEVTMLAGFGDGVGSFFRLDEGVAEVFVWSTREVFDMEHLLERELEFEVGMDEYVPAIIFLRRAFGPRCWHAPAMRAEIVIDDPLLVRKYGFVDFSELLREAEEKGFHITVAFIPWNHRRTTQRMAAVFRKSAAHFGICAHGCDHSRDEFLAVDDADLLERSHLAGERMDQHRERTGLPWDRLMVCPREDYSLAGLRAICESGRFLGLANSGCIPRRLGSAQVRGSDLLQPAQDAFFGFPVFKRHYWTGIPAFALSTFLGKPAILAEHHAVCRDERRALNEFTGGIESMCPGLRWTNLEEIALKTCVARRISPSVIEVRFFAEEFVMENPDASPTVVRFQKRIPPEVAVDSVLVNRVGVGFVRNGEMVEFEATVAAGASVAVKICRIRPPRPERRARCFSYKVGVAVRRYASELRDQILARNSALLSFGNGVARFLGMRR